MLAPPLQPAVSVALATYNGERFFDAQLASIAAQTRAPAELVIGDDGSNDATLALIERFAATAPFPVRVTRNAERLGFRRNFRATTERCESPLIAFCDQDDVWAPTKIEQMSACFADPRLLLVYHGALVIDGAGHALHRMYDGASEAARLAVHPCHPFHHGYGLTQMFRADLRRFDDLWDLSFDHITDEGDILAHDQWYYFLAAALGRIAFLDEDLVHYRQHGSNSFGAPPERSRWRRLADRFEHYAEQDRRAERGAQSRADVLTAIAGREPALAERATMAAACYQAYAARLARRARSFGARNPVTRMSGLVSSLLAGDYRGRPWGFDPRSLPRDMWWGVVRRSDRPQR